MASAEMGTRGLDGRHVGRGSSSGTGDCQIVVVASTWDGERGCRRS